MTSRALMLPYVTLHTTQKNEDILPRKRNMVEYDVQLTFLLA